MQTLDQEFVFQQAINITDPSARNEFLDRSCAGDSESRKRIGQLVDLHLSSGRILDKTRACPIDSQSSAAVPDVGSMIGPYKLLQEIGQGGMGVVFMAQQTVPMKRMVALKVIKIGMDTRRVVARFESERQAMALMDHPCITKVLDAGATESGRPYFVMELVRGKSVTTYCDERQLSLRERLKIFVQICNALEHAHQKGIIHRDIKPNNILVTNHDGQPTAKIIDFGIAKAVNERLTEKTLFTNYGEMVGTPLYMSPEQAEMSEPDVDTRTDIYSLGVLLYELLTGTTPFYNLEKTSWQDIRDAIRSREPQLASTRVNNLGITEQQISRNRDTDTRSLHRFIRGELDWILMKCLARDRKLRYQSAGQLAREIERYLNGEPVEAAAPTWGYRTRKLIARHKAGATIAASFAAILFVGSLFSTMMAIRANNAQQLAKSRLQEVIKERDRALAAERQLAELERKQRNRVAIHQAAATYNADMVKRYLANVSNDHANAPNEFKSPAIQLRTMESFWEPTTANYPVAGSPLKCSQSETLVAFAPDHQPAPFVFDNDPDNCHIEVICVADEKSENEETLLKTILKNQREAFGKRDVLVAGTLNQLGQLMSDKKNWQQSESYFREACEILKDQAENNPQLSAIQIKLAHVLKNQGNWKKAIAELQSIKDDLRNVELPEEISGLLNNIKLEIRQKNLNSKPDET